MSAKVFSNHEVKCERDSTLTTAGLFIVAWSTRPLTLLTIWVTGKGSEPGQLSGLTGSGRKLVGSEWRTLGALELHGQALVDEDAQALRGLGCGDADRGGYLRNGLRAPGERVVYRFVLRVEAVDAGLLAIRFPAGWDGSSDNRAQRPRGLRE